jgi:hypothetical protein
MLLHGKSVPRCLEPGDLHWVGFVEVLRLLHRRSTFGTGIVGTGSLGIYPSWQSAPHIGKFCLSFHVRQASDALRGNLERRDRRLSSLDKQVSAL